MRIITITAVTTNTNIALQEGEPTVVQLSDAAAKAAKIDIKQKY